MVAFKRVFATVAAHDMARARSFYERVLGLTPIGNLPEGLIYQVGDSSLFLYPSQWAGTAGHTVASFEVDDVREVVRDLRAHGVVFEEYDMPGLKTVDGIVELEGESAAWFKDTEGNILALAQTR